MTTHTESTRAQAVCNAITRPHATRPSEGPCHLLPFPYLLQRYLRHALANPSPAAHRSLRGTGNGDVLNEVSLRRSYVCGPAPRTCSCLGRLLPLFEERWQPAPQSLDQTVAASRQREQEGFVQPPQWIKA
ncbi:hypothetical protein Barb4_02894 [Bacteroidales bacterium Barb4]|nr:hypothetical protein Barb4_02894 [Bacteroidales bacterium Barb4]